MSTPLFSEILPLTNSDTSPLIRNYDKENATNSSFLTVHSLTGIFPQGRGNDSFHYPSAQDMDGGSKKIQV